MAEPAFIHRVTAAAILGEVGNSVDQWVRYGEVVEPLNHDLISVARGLFMTEQETRSKTLGEVVIALVSDRETTHQRNQWAPVLKRLETEYEARNG